MGATKIAHHIFFGVASFLMRDDNAALRIEQRESARHRFVIRETPVAVQFGPAGKTAFDVIERERPLHMSRGLHALPCGQVSVNFATGIAEFGFDSFDLGIKIDIVLARMFLQVLQPSLQFEDRFFEIERLKFGGH